MKSITYSYASVGVGARAELTVVVTGGAGFLGSHLCEHLVNQGHRVFCVDNFHTGRRDNVGALAASGRFEVIEHDIVAPFDLQASPFRPHLQSRLPGIAAALPGRSRPDGADLQPGDLQLPAGGEAKRRACSFMPRRPRSTAIPRYIRRPKAYHGNVNTVGPRSCYDEGKRFAETLVTDYGRRHGLVTRMARIFNTYGPRMQPDDGRVVSNFVVQALLGKDITVYGSGEQTRSFCYVSDLIDGFARLMANGDGTAWPGQPRQPRRDDGGRTRPPHHRPGRQPLEDHPQAPARRRSAPPAAGHHPGRAVLGWSPNVDLTVGLRRTIAHFDDRLRTGSLHHG